MQKIKNNSLITNSNQYNNDTNNLDYSTKYATEKVTTAIKKAPKKTYNTIKKTAIAIKTTAKATKALIAAISGGIPILIIIVVICVIGLLCSLFYKPNDNRTFKQFETLLESVMHGWFGNTRIVEVAKEQIGNVGGEPYWSWYGFDERVEWCACFVSWCANECGYIEKEIIPKFAGCQSEGVEWFKEKNLWQGKDYIPKEGDIIFFDWEDNDISDHVGIVEKVENGQVYTIEGNASGDVCKQNIYDLGSSVIQGYGTPAYQD